MSTSSLLSAEPGVGTGQVILCAEDLHSSQRHGPPAESGCIRTSDCCNVQAPEKALKHVHGVFIATVCKGVKESERKPGMM